MALMWKLAMFVLLVVVYFAVLGAFEQWPPASLLTIVIKVLPIGQLWILVASSSEEERAPVSKQQRGKSPSESGEHPAGSGYRRSVLIGLAFSALGDTLLVMRNSCFLAGAASFAVAQAMYIRAFGLRPVGKTSVTAAYAALAASVYAVVFGTRLSAGIVESPALRAVIGVYIALINCMAWRAAARYQRARTLGSLAAAVGALVFMASDFMIVLDKFGPSFHLAPFWIILTYYAAQCLIALSAVLP